jgi:hypothetical protein
VLPTKEIEIVTGGLTIRIGVQYSVDELSFRHAFSLEVYVGSERNMGVGVLTAVFDELHEDGA